MFVYAMIRQTNPSQEIEIVKLYAYNLSMVYVIATL